MNRTQMHLPERARAPRTPQNPDQYDWYFEWRRDQEPDTFWSRRAPDREPRRREPAVRLRSFRAR